MSLEAIKAAFVTVLVLMFLILILFLTYRGGELTERKDIIISCINYGKLVLNKNETLVCNLEKNN